MRPLTPCSGLLLEQAIVLLVMANPDPEEPIRYVHSQRPIRKPYASGPKASYLLEAQRGMRGVILQLLKVVICQFFDMGRKVTVMLPEPAACPMVQSFLVFPARCSRRASSARKSSLPASTSFSILRSQASASRSRNQCRKRANSSGFSPATALWISSTVLIGYLTA